MKIIALLATVVIAAVVAATPQTKPKNQILHLAPGKCRYSYCRGEKVKDLQWLLAGHRPNVFNKVKPTFKGKPNGLYGLRTARAVYAYKYRIGYPEKYNSKKYPIAGHDFFSILEGKEKRPAYWVMLAQHRLQVAESGVTPMAYKIKQYETSQLGVHETCCNTGPVVDMYERHFGLYAQPWCAIFQNYSFWRAGYRPSPFVPPPYNPFYVPSIISWAEAHSYLNAKAKVGSLVAYYGDISHIGYVVKIVGGSGYVTIEGNEGDAVREVYHPWNDRLRVFIDIPGIA